MVFIHAGERSQTIWRSFVTVTCYTAWIQTGKVQREQERCHCGKRLSLIIVWMKDGLSQGFNLFPLRSALAACYSWQSLVVNASGHWTNQRTHSLLLLYANLIQNCVALSQFWGECVSTLIPVGIRNVTIAFVDSKTWWPINRLRVSFSHLQLIVLVVLGHMAFLETSYTAPSNRKC